jgi:antitoxin component of MazEF toxin-antitoxin module
MAEVFEAKVRPVGNSLGIIIPREAIRKNGIRNGDTIKVALPCPDLTERNRKIRKIAGTLKGTGPFVREKEDRF